MNKDSRLKYCSIKALDMKKIANVIGLSSDLTRDYCVRNCLNGHPTELVTEYHKIMEEEFIYIMCLNCGVKTEQNKNGRKKKY